MPVNKLLENIIRERFGDPLVDALNEVKVYHGSPIELSEVIPDPDQRKTLNSLGVWLTSSSEAASYYGEHVHEVELPNGKFFTAKNDDIERTFFDPTLAQQFGVGKKWNNTTRNALMFNWDYLTAWRDKLMSQGYAGIVWRNSFIDRDAETETPHDVYLVFSSLPAQRSLGSQS